MRGSSSARQAFRRAAKNFAGAVPVIVGILGLTSLTIAALPPHLVADVLPQEGVLGPLLGAALGSISVGHAMTSYLLAAEFVAAGLSLATATALLVAWVTVGIVQLPAEAASLGLRFAVWRNGVSFGLAVLTAYVVASATPFAQ